MKITVVKIASLSVAVLLLGAFQRVPGGGTVPGDPAFRIQIDSSETPPYFGWGRPATQAEIGAWDKDVRPDGQGLPPGAGLVAPGKAVYAVKCAACHGVDGTGGPNSALVTPPPDSLSKRKEKTIGNYWPHATTVYDYIRRAMPFNQPGSLSDAEVYHLTAYLLFANRIIDEKTVLDSQTLSNLVMPARDRFVRDDRQGGATIR